MPAWSRVLSRGRAPLPAAVRRHDEMRLKEQRGRTIADSRFVAVDTELTGLNIRRDSIISIGAVRLDGVCILPGQTFYRLVRPSAELRREGVVIHELTHSDLERAAPPREVLEEFLEFAGERVLVGHFAHIEQSFIDRALRQTFGTRLRCPVVDTASLHDWLTENDTSFAGHHGGVSFRKDLVSLATRYGIEMQEVHNAFFDAYVTAQLFQRLAHFLPGCGVLTLGELLSVGRS